MGNCFSPQFPPTQDSVSSKYSNDIKEGEKSVAHKAPPPLPPLRVLGYSQPDIQSHYNFGDVLGKGRYGTVHQVTHVASGHQYACKCIQKSNISNPKEVLHIQREVHIWHHVSGDPNTISLRNVYEDDDNAYLVIDYCSGGELFERISSQGSFSEQDAAAYLRTMVSLVARIHSLGVIHRDLKPENFLLSDKSSSAALKLTDFGLSTFFHEGQVLDETLGTPYCVAPEVLDKRYGKECDIWGLGIIIYTMLCGYPPFWGKTENETLDQVLHSPVAFTFKSWRSISDAAKDCISCMLEKDPSKRATAQDILNHTWLKPSGAESRACVQHEVLVRLKRFARMNKFQKEALRVIASSLPAHEVAGLKELFNTYDRYKKGAVCATSLQHCLQRQGVSLTEHELDWIVGNVSVRMPGAIYHDDFIAATLPLTKLECDQKLQHAFQQFDRHHTGYITRATLHEVMGGSEDSTAVDEVLEEADQDRDGKIGFQDFCTLMRAPSLVLE